MRLIWTETSEVSPKKWGSRCVKGKFCKFPEALEEIHGALKDGYGITFIGDNEFRHLIALIRYESGGKTIYAFMIHGTRGEISDIQKDETVSLSMFR